MAKKKSWQEISKEPQQIEKRRAKDAARSAAHKREQLEKGMLARNTALNKMGYNGYALEVYKTQAASYGVETTPAPIKTIDASVEPPEIAEYPEYRGASDLLSSAPAAPLPVSLSLADSRKLLADLNAQHTAGLHARRMRRARAILQNVIGRRK